MEISVDKYNNTINVSKDMYDFLHWLLSDPSNLHFVVYKDEDMTYTLGGGTYGEKDGMKYYTLNNRYRFHEEKKLAESMKCKYCIHFRKDCKCDTDPNTIMNRCRDFTRKAPIDKDVDF